jgi:16S rRNA (guanine527-N7)-methyltransferase
VFDGALDGELLARVAAARGVALSQSHIAAFEHYAAELVDWNTRVNLTRIVGPDEIAVRHFLDSLVCLRGLADDVAPAEALSCIDVGSGAGLPGLALKIVRPAWRMTLVESVGKKTTFLRHVVDVLGLRDVTVLTARAEEIGRDPAHRERHDLAVARGVADLPVLAEYLVPLLRVGGRMLALKGEGGPDEASRTAPGLLILGAHLIDVQPYDLPGVPGTRHLVIAEKTAPTPAKYPRRPGVPEKRPLAGADAHAAHVRFA